jgi:hypothetical protein
LWTGGSTEERSKQDRRTSSYDLYSYASPRLDWGTGRVGQPASDATLAFYGKARPGINPK